MNGFTAADMSTAAANGHRDGYQAGYADAVKAFEPAAAQEAVAWSEGYASGVIDERTSEANIGIAGFGEKVEPARANPYLLAAPVAAAPIDGWDAQAYSQMAGELEAWKLRAVTAEGDFNRLCNAMNAEDGPTHMGEPVLNTPAAPGIDLREPMRNLYRAYVRLLESGMDRITSLGGDCDPVDVMEANDIDLRAAREALDASPKGAVHPDDLAVDAFAAAMKAKLAEARAKGRGGWNGDEPDMQERLSGMLRDHVEKGDPRDVANFCMFLHQRGEGISPKGGINSRATFEAWAAGKILPLHRMQIHIGIMGDYSDAWTHCAWTAWQAAMLAARPQGVKDA